ncbi:AT-rich interactive domain-containing protein 2-like isoform X2 [Corticium candelabrum]|uniref:AT-rich interactive domain-containing protein 2-like isoform X2 n=1 Tax=Corticium candelabrum TaxID=121492 RepID=UPI002E254E63|nr:AT-rich interactive domain-containing protein 2-like isoform X2 [Corticium candelabrum]
MDCAKYTREYKKFAANVQRVSAERGVQLERLPLLNGIEVDLLKLYKSVSALGGFDKVNCLNLWNDVAVSMGLPLGTCNVEMSVRMIYSKYLLGCESVDVLGDEEEIEIAKFLPDNRPWTRSKSVNLTTAAPHKADFHTGRNTETITGETYDRLILGLTSGFPNEVDFAINTCLLLSYDEEKPFFLAQVPQLVPLLLAQIGVFTADASSYETSICQLQPAHQKTYFLKFWEKSRQSFQADISTSLSHTLYMIDMLASFLVCDAVKTGNVDNDNLFAECCQDLPDNEWMLFRTVQVLSILNNLSCTEDNAYQLSQSMLCFQLLLWCIDGDHSFLKQLAASCLANVADQITLKVSQSFQDVVFGSLEHCLSSSDRLLLLKGLEVLAKLCTVEDNSDILYTNLKKTVYARLCESLLLADVEVRIGALEALYQLTCLGTGMCNVIITFLGFVDMLGSLLTFQMSSVGKDIESKTLQTANCSTSTAPVERKLVSLGEASEPVRNASHSDVVACTHMHVSSVQVKDGRESEARKWLSDSYGVDQQGSLLLAKMYSDYIKWISVDKMAHGINLQLFHKLVKSVFPNSKQKLIGNEKNIVIVGVTNKQLVCQSKPKKSSAQVSCQQEVTANVVDNAIVNTPYLILTTTAGNRAPVSSITSSSPSLHVCSASEEICWRPLYKTTESQQDLPVSVHLQPLASSHRLTSSAVGSTQELFRNSHNNQCQAVTSLVNICRTPVMTTNLGSSEETDKHKQSLSNFQVASVVPVCEGKDTHWTNGGCETLPSQKETQYLHSNKHCGLLAASRAATPMPPHTSSVSAEKEDFEPFTKQAKTTDNYLQTTSTFETSSSESQGASYSLYRLVESKIGNDVHWTCTNGRSVNSRVTNGVVLPLISTSRLHVMNCVASSYGAVSSSTSTREFSTPMTEQAVSTSSKGAVGSISEVITDSHRSGEVHFQPFHQRVNLVQSGRSASMGTKPLLFTIKPNTAVDVVPLVKFVASKQLDLQATDEESPLTKTVRLTAALVIRNLLIHSPLAARQKDFGSRKSDVRVKPAATGGFQCFS